MGIKAKPAKTAGIPRVTPDNTDVPPRCSIYAFDEETTMKNDICVMLRIDRWTSLAAHLHEEIRSYDDNQRGGLWQFQLRIEGSLRPYVHSDWSHWTPT